MPAAETVPPLTDLEILTVSLDPADFAAFKSIYKDDRGGIDDQKLLEYYVSYRFLEFSPDDVYIDVAAQNCPFAFFVRERFGCKVYRQDLYYIERGLHGDEIGGDASRLPLADETVSRMSLHNSFEHFEGNRDIRFIREAQRVLRHGGRMIICPLEFEGAYRIEKNAGWVDGGGRKHVWAKGARFSRYYDTAQFRSRVLLNAPALDAKVYLIENIREMGQGCYGGMFVLFEKVRPAPPRSWIERMLPFLPRR